MHGYYGIEQWEYLICTQQLEYPINFMNDELHTDEDLEEWAKHRYMYATTDEEYDALVAAWELLTLENLVNYNVYDLENDPGEHVNLYGCPDYAEEQMRMLELLADRMAQTADPLPLRRAFW